MAAKRQYRLRKRAAEMDETRRRITEAAVELHGTVGPARTTMSGVAERAGVERHTVYRHFPTEAELFGACSAHYLGANPPPDPGPWRAIADPHERLASALNDIYAFYERTEPMFTNVFRDVDLVEALQPSVALVQGYLSQVTELLASGFRVRDERSCLVEAAIGHALNFHVWRSLAAGTCVTRADAVRLACALVEAARARQAAAV
jgi:AcrR family transcriptional regulator